MFISGRIELAITYNMASNLKDILLPYLFLSTQIHHLLLLLHVYLVLLITIIIVIVGGNVTVHCPLYTLLVPQSIRTHDETGNGFYVQNMSFLCDST